MEFAQAATSALLALLQDQGAQRAAHHLEGLAPQELARLGSLADTLSSLSFSLAHKGVSNVVV